MNPRTIEIAGRKVGFGQPCFIIAEAGVNHNGDVALAKRLVNVAAKAGADAVKFQTFKADQIVGPTAPKAAYQLRSTDKAESQLDMLRKLELSPDAHREIQAYCHGEGILFLSTPFDKESVDLLNDLGVPAFKVASGEITNVPFLKHVARKGKPMILSTGMAYLGEVEKAVHAVEKTGNHDVILLHCVSNYPADPSDVNLRAMKTMAEAFALPVGYSDHTLGIEVSIAAVALGACVIEKHFTLDRSLPGPDHGASLEPGDIEDLVKSIRAVEASLGQGRKEPAASEADTAALARRSLYTTRDLKKGHTLVPNDLIALRPGTGISPSRLSSICNRKLNQDLRSGNMLREKYLE